MGAVALRTTPHNERRLPDSGLVWLAGSVGARAAEGLFADAMGGAAAIICAGSISLNEVGEVGDGMPGPVGEAGEMGKRRMGSLSEKIG